MMDKRFWSAVLGLCCLGFASATRCNDLTDGRSETAAPFALPASVELMPDVAYGNDSRQRLDLYRPVAAHHSPLIVLVHGGGWAHGDKAANAVVENKVRRWATRGFLVLSLNYRLLPDAAPLTQVEDVAAALAFAQRHARQWGGDPTAIVLMGHSAGAHLAALISASSEIKKRAGVAPWLATIALDSAAFNVEVIMDKRHLRLYDKAFGDEPRLWRAASPYHVLDAEMPPMLAVCSTRREIACKQAQAFATKARTFGVMMEVLPQDLSHYGINAQLGLPSAYTDAVENFLRHRDERLATLLSR